MEERFVYGDRVVTLAKPETEPPGYAKGARDGNQWGVPGIVIGVSDSHGLCYEVRTGGTIGWYEPNELRPA